MKRNPAHSAAFASTLLLLSCAAPKAIVVMETPAAAPKAEKKPEVSAPTEPAATAAVDEGIRLPDMLGMPGDGEFRSARPKTNPSGGPGAVIARPPSEAQR